MAHPQGAVRVELELSDELIAALLTDLQARREAAAGAVYQCLMAGSWREQGERMAAEVREIDSVLERLVSAKKGREH